MSIEFHCEHCGKSIKAPSEAAGQRGKCPACHLSVYIPTPTEEIEPLNLAPVDRKEEAERQRSLQEAREFQRRLLGERDLPGEPPGRAAPREGGVAVPAGRVDMERLVINYAVCMADGDLQGAESIARQIRSDIKAAENVMQQLTIDEVPHPSLSKIPRPVLVGFFKQLREKK